MCEWVSLKCTVGFFFSSGGQRLSFNFFKACVDAGLG